MSSDLVVPAAVAAELDAGALPRLRSAADDDTEGRGLTIAEALTRRWWVEEHETGKTVWAEVPLAASAA